MECWSDTSADNVEKTHVRSAYAPVRPCCLLALPLACTLTTLLPGSLLIGGERDASTYGPLICATLDSHCARCRVWVALVATVRASTYRPATRNSLSISEKSNLIRLAQCLANMPQMLCLSGVMRTDCYKASSPPSHCSHPILCTCAHFSLTYSLNRPLCSSIVISYIQDVSLHQLLFTSSLSIQPPSRRPTTIFLPRGHRQSRHQSSHRYPRRRRRLARSPPQGRPARSRGAAA